MNTTSLDSKSIDDFCENLLNEENCNLFELEKRTIQYVHKLTAKALKIALEWQDDKLFESKSEELKVVSKKSELLLPRLEMFLFIVAGILINMAILNTC